MKQAGVTFGFLIIKSQYGGNTCINQNKNYHLGIYQLACCLIFFADKLILTLHGA